MQKKYEVIVLADTRHNFTVSAENEDEAVEIVRFSNDWDTHDIYNVEREVYVKELKQ